MSTMIKNECAGMVNGVPGRFHNVITWPNQPQVLERVRGLIANQEWTSETRKPKGYGPGAEMRVRIRHDDNCKNGHETFSITAEITTPESRRHRDIAAGGCLHDEIAKTFPELVPLIRWHLCSTDGPMHYVANTCHHATDCDYNGYRKGEPCSWVEVIRFGDFPITISQKKDFRAWLKEALAFRATTPTSNPNRPSFDVVAVAHDKDPKTYSANYSLAGYAEGCSSWYKAPFSTRREADEFAEALHRYPVTFEKIVTEYSDGKARNFAAARSCAVWPDAPDEVLSLPRPELEKILLDRLPALLAEFRAAVEGAGFIFTGAQS